MILILIISISFAIAGFIDAIVSLIQEKWVELLLTLIIAPGIFEGIRWLINRLRREKKEVEKSIKLINIKDINKHAPAIMGERGHAKNGFDDTFYYIRPAQTNGKSFDEKVAYAIKNTPITILYGTYGMGKSRAVYEYLKNEQTCIFKNVAVLANEGSLSCSLDELGEYIEKKIAKPNTLLFIDNIHNRRQDKDQPINWDEWIDKVFMKVLKKQGRIVITCLKDPKEEDKKVTVRLSDIEKEITTIPIPPVDKKMHSALAGQYATTDYSPIVGNYIGSMENFQRILKKEGFQHNEQLLLAIYTFLSPYFYDRGKQRNFLRKAYRVICNALPEWCETYLDRKSIGEKLVSELQVEERNSTSDTFAFAWDSLSQTRNILSGNDNRCTIQDNIFVSKFIQYICEKSYDIEQNHSEDEVLDLFCAMLMTNRKQLLYQQEKWYADLIIALDNETPDMYTRPITRATGHNERLIAKYVKEVFDKQFFVCEENPSKDSYRIIGLKEEYKQRYNNAQDTFKHGVHRAIGIILARRYDNWQSGLEEYQNARIIIQNDVDIIGELLRIAADERSSQKDKDAVITYLNARMGLEQDLAEMAKSNVRIAVNYENLCPGFNAERIKNTLQLFAQKIPELEESIKRISSKKDNDQMEQLETEQKYLFRSLLSWTKMVVSKINTDRQRMKDCDCALEDLIKILDNSEIINCIRVIQKTYRDYLFFNRKVMGLVAQNIHLHYPLCFIDIYKSCIALIKDNISQGNSVIFAQRSLEGFIYSLDYNDGVKTEKGILSEIDSVETTIELIDAMRDKKSLNILDDHSLTTDAFYANCLFELISKIIYADNEESKRANYVQVKDYIDKIFTNRDEKEIIIGSKRKIYNYLLKNAPWDEAVKLINSEFLSRNYDMYTINTFFTIARNEYKHLETAAEKDEILKEILEKGGWVDSKEDTLMWGPDTKSALKPIKAEGKYKNAFDALINKISESHIATNEITNAQEWKSLPLEQKKDLVSALQLYFESESQKYKEEANRYYKHYDNAKEIREQIRIFTSDNITNLIGKCNDLFNKFIKGEGLNPKERSKFGPEQRTLLFAILGILREMTWPENGRETIDRYFAPKIYYYDQVRALGVLNLSNSELNKNQTVEDRWIFFERALERLTESEQALAISDDELRSKGKNMQNLLEHLVSLGTFEESIVLAERAKEKAKIDIYKSIYRPLVIKMLCNKLKSDLYSFDETQAMNIVEERIIRFNALMADPELILAFDNANASIIMRANTYLRKKNPKYPKERFFENLNPNISIQLPICSSNDIVRHKAWDMYEAQDYIDKLHLSAIKFFAASEIRSLVAPIYEQREDIDLSYLFNAIRKLNAILEAGQEDVKEAKNAVDYIKSGFEIQFIQWCKKNGSVMPKESILDFLLRGGACMETLREFPHFFEALI